MAFGRGRTPLVFELGRVWPGDADPPGSGRRWVSWWLTPDHACHARTDSRRAALDVRGLGGDAECPLSKVVLDCQLAKASGGAFCG